MSLASVLEDAAKEMFSDFFLWCEKHWMCDEKMQKDLEASAHYKMGWDDAVKSLSVAFECYGEELEKNDD